ncbi:MAG: cadmium-translocating P-type ATPase, partial [Clostridia bacterium]|nr:cadmium-translocating P-type ATPase [Clostridia bacterium]
PYEASTVARILDLVENAAINKSRSEAFLTRFARVYTPAVVGAALLLAVVPPLFAGGWATWLTRALNFLVVSCPCALVISVPLAFFGGIGGAGRRGVLIKGSQYVEALCRADTVVFDKTGTLTEGVFEVTAVHPSQWDRDAVLRLAAIAERGSDHPVARSLCRAWQGEAAPASDVREVAGMGLTAAVEGHAVAVGNEVLMASLGVESRPCHHVGTIIHVAVDGAYAGHIVISDRVKESARGLTAALKAKGIRRTVMLTGDRAAVAEKVAAELGVDDWQAELLPADKVAQVEKLTAEQGGAVLFVGDGINDAPVLMRADVGVAMGALGADAAIEAADVVLMDDDPRKLTTALAVARKTMRVVRENVFGALGVKGGVLVLSALGLTGMWLAVLADVGVLILAILNALRAGSVKG